MSVYSGFVVEIFEILLETEICLLNPKQLMLSSKGEWKFKVMANFPLFSCIFCLLKSVKNAFDRYFPYWFCISLTKCLSFKFWIVFSFSKWPIEINLKPWGRLLRLKSPFKLGGLCEGIQGNILWLWNCSWKSFRKLLAWSKVIRYCVDQSRTSHQSRG